jgi:alpha-ketoglutarate-dependent taurine dioxygenase
MCGTAPTAPGGETILIDGCAFFEALPVKLKTRFIQEGITYRMVWEPPRWKNEFNVANQAELKRFLAARENVKYSLNDEILELQFTTPAITKTQFDHRDAFATGLLAHLPRLHHPHYEYQLVPVTKTNQVFFGNGEAFDEATVNTLVDIHDRLMYKHRWQDKDVLVIDNSRFLHGRTMTAFECERVLFSCFGWLHTSD